MKFEVLKRSNLKRNIIIGILGIAVISTIILNFTRAKYRTTQSIPLVNGTINYSLADLDIVGLYINGVEATELDDYTKYTLDTSKSTCTYKDGSTIDNLRLTYDSDTKTFTISPYTTKGTKCTLYFDELILVKDSILANYPTVLTRDDFTTTVTNTTTGTIYKSKDSSQYDNDGEVYYFAGNPTDNWVKFANKYWRIIRINGDGSIRMIYQGTSANATGTQTETSIFNSTYNNNMYVGYMYQSNQVQGLSSSSTIKKVLDSWYQSNLASYASKIDGNAGFCGDRTPYSGSGIGTSTTYYAAYNRLYTNKTPTFKCTNNSDLYTTSGSSDGNRALTYPIALITADEVAFAGGVYGTPNQSYYLYTGESYWTLSPRFYSSGAYVFAVNSSGILNGIQVAGSPIGVCPVINLKADVQIISGNGTSNDPYIIN